VYVGDWVLRAIDLEIAARPPERGGALLGPRGRPFVTAFAPDPDATTTSSSFRPSRALAARVKELERDALLELKGIVHSHPRGVDRPSEQDARELATGLRLNGHMSCYLAPIVTEDHGSELDHHELPLTGAKISFFAAWRAGADSAEVRPLRPHSVPLVGDLERVSRALGGGAPEIFAADLGLGTLAGGRVGLAAGELLVLVHELYPALPPVALFTPSGGETEQLHLAWPVERALSERLHDGVLRALAARGTIDAGALFARSAGLLTPALGRRRVLVAGCGSVGSYMAEQLVRSGVGAVELVDPEAVEAANLSRAGYDAADVGSPKAVALSERLRRVSPALRVGVHVRAIEAFDLPSLDALVRAVDLVVAATDDPAAQRVLNRFAYARGRPALFTGLYAGAKGGEVIVVVPEQTPCYVCATRIRHAAEDASGRVGADIDYGSGRLDGEVALGADIHHVSSAAVKLALSLLVRGEPQATLASFAEDAVREGATYLTMSTVPRYWFYPDVFGATAGQGAYQSVWLTPASDEECPVCGAGEERLDPLRVPLRAPGRHAFGGADRA
jgi:molybdopterin/thiamine biosynthesis adenylyltransferase/proteasome lid subunit RPN8/RPN11